MSFQGTTRTDPYERSLAHAALISDEWRRSGQGARDELFARRAEMLPRVVPHDPTSCNPSDFVAEASAARGQ